MSENKVPEAPTVDTSLLPAEGGMIGSGQEGGLVDQARAALINAEGAVREAEASLAEARLRLGPTNADNPSIKQAIANLARAGIDLGDTLVKAPVNGIVTNTVLADCSHGSWISDADAIK